MANNKENLVEIKKGELGYGLLIENDGYISGDISSDNKKMIKEFQERNSDEWFVPKPFIVDVVLQKFGIKNANGRIYPENILKREVAKYQKIIDQRMALGECNHPAEPTIDLGRISHNIVECHWEGNTLVGKLEFNITEGFRKHGICSSFGDTCANLYLNGYKIGVSSRAVGSVKTVMGDTIINNDLELICWDVVATPSTPGAYIGMRSELEQYMESDNSRAHKSQITEKVNRLKNIIL